MPNIEKVVVLCVSADDQIRGIMMKGFLQRRFRKLGLTNILCESCGMDGGYADTRSPAHDGAIWILRDRGAGDFSNHRSRWIQRLSVERYQLFICINQRAVRIVERMGISPEQILNANIPELAAFGDRGMDGFYGAAAAIVKSARKIARNPIWKKFEDPV